MPLLSDLQVKKSFWRSKWRWWCSWAARILVWWTESKYTTEHIQPVSWYGEQRVSTRQIMFSPYLGMANRGWVHDRTYSVRILVWRTESKYTTEHIQSVSWYGEQRVSTRQNIFSPYLGMANRGWVYDRTYSIRILVWRTESEYTTKHIQSVSWYGKQRVSTRQNIFSPYLGMANRGWVHNRTCSALSWYGEKSVSTRQNTFSPYLGLVNRKWVHNRKCFVIPLCYAARQAAYSVRHTTYYAVNFA